MRCALVVDGRPVPQGSMTASYNRKLGVAHVHHVQGTALAVWRATIRESAKAMGISPSPLPISISIVFGMPRPKSQQVLKGGRYQTRIQDINTKPAVAPDIDKLVRAVLDALTGICYADDAQVVEVHASKVYASETRIEVTDEFDEAQQTLAFGMG